MLAANTNFEQREDFSSARQMFNAMTQFLESDTARQMRHDDLEGYVVNKGRELQRQMLQEHLNLRGEVERSLRVVDSGGTERVERRRGNRRLMSLVGEVTVPRLLYQVEGGIALCPQDGALNLPVESYSLGVRRRVAEEVASGSFDHAVERIHATTGAEVAKRQAEELAQRACVDFEGYYALSQDEPTGESDKLLVLTFDGAAIVMRTEDLRPATRKAAERDKANPKKSSKRLKKGEKRNRKRVVQVTAVYEVDPHIRESKDVLGELRPVQDTTPKKPRPKPVNKRVRAGVTKDAAMRLMLHFRMRSDVILNGVGAGSSW